MKPQSIVVAVDFSEPSDRALEMAVQRARRDGAQLHIVHALEAPVPVYSAYTFDLPPEYMETARSEALRLLEDALKTAARSGVDAKSHLRHGPACTAVVDIAQELDADLVIVGTHGHTGLKHFTLGSVAERIVRHVHCSVLVAKGDTHPCQYTVARVADNLSSL